MKGHFAAVVLVVVGAFMLLSNLGLINIDLVEVARTWWPAILIALGVSMFLTGRGKKPD